MSESNDTDERVARLVEQFAEFTRQYYYAAYDIDDQDRARVASVNIFRISKELDAIPPGRRSALVPLLDSDDLRLRTSAATYLANSMPDLALPVLRAVDALKNGVESMRAMTTLFMYECGDLRV
jgi:hypothetical protein